MRTGALARGCGEAPTASASTCRTEGCERGGKLRRGKCSRCYQAWLRARNRDRFRELGRAQRRRSRGIRWDVGRCCVCAGSFALNRDGTLIRHRTADGAHCDGFDRYPAAIVAVAS